MTVPWSTSEPGRRGEVLRDVRLLDRPHLDDLLINAYLLLVVEFGR